MSEGTEAARNESLSAIEHDVLLRRLEMLRAELAEGEARLRQVEAERTRLHETLLRIEGAIVVLQELAGSAGE